MSSVCVACDQLFDMPEQLRIQTPTSRTVVFTKCMSIVSQVIYLLVDALICDSVTGQDVNKAMAFRQFQPSCLHPISGPSQNQYMDFVASTHIGRNS
jgi:hypothetical protein